MLKNPPILISTVASLSPTAEVLTPIAIDLNKVFLVFLTQSSAIFFDEIIGFFIRMMCFSFFYLNESCSPETITQSESEKIKEQGLEMNEGLTRANQRDSSL